MVEILTSEINIKDLHHVSTLENKRIDLMSDRMSKVAAKNITVIIQKQMFEFFMMYFDADNNQWTSDVLM